MVFYSIWLRRFSKFTALATLLLIFVGGLVTSTGSGLSVPDWPNTYGYFMFSFPFSKWVGGIFYEHLHRLVASFVGLLTLVFAFWLWKSDEQLWLKNLGWGALAAVITQGVLGGITVLFLLPTPVSVTHGVVAQSFFCVIIAMAYFLSSEWKHDEAPLTHPGNESFFRWTALAASFIFAQLILGAVMRHTGSGLAIMDYPLATGRLIPAFNGDTLFIVNDARFDLGLDSVTLSQITIHFVHRLGALLASIGIIGVAILGVRNYSQEKRIAWPALFLAALLAIQLTLAGFIVWSGRNPVITTFHVWTGALMLGTSVLLSLRSYRILGINFWPIARSVPSGVAARTRQLVISFFELTKPGITGLVLVAAGIGFYLALNEAGSSLGDNVGRLIHLLIGTALVSGGVGALNEFIERDDDLRMYRTMERPVPAGHLSPFVAMMFGTVISICGIAYLAIALNVLTSLLAFATLVLYLYVYTPLKKKTTLNTLVGAVPGALPPMGGWVAAGGDLTLGAWILFGILFLWQIPHFFSIGWLYRNDYKRTGFRMVPVTDDTGRATALYVIMFCLALLGCSLSLSFVGITGGVYLAGATLLGLVFLAAGTNLALKKTDKSARQLLIASVIYLPLLLIVMVLDVGIIG